MHACVGCSCARRMHWSGCPYTTLWYWLTIRYGHIITFFHCLIIIISIIINSIVIGVRILFFILFFSVYVVYAQRMHVSLCMQICMYVWLRVFMLVEGRDIQTFCVVC
jgi:hypothetical protein